MLKDFSKTLIYGLHAMSVFILPLQYAVLVYFLAKCLFYIYRFYSPVSSGDSKQ